MIGNKTPASIILIIGNEILNGKTLDTNSQFISKKLYERGIDIIKRVTIPDDMDVMVHNIRELSAQCDFLFSSGGIGSTPDDLTRQAFAEAFNLPLARHAEAEKILNDFAGDSINEIRLRMADLPEGCQLIYNPFFGAPGFIIRNCFVFPGIPELLVGMFDQVEKLLPMNPRLMKYLRTKFKEGDFADIMNDVQRKYPQVSIGSYPAFKNPEYMVELTFSGWDEVEIDNAMKEFEKLLLTLE